MLARVDTRMKRLEHLIVARKQRLAENFGVPQVKSGLHRRRGDRDAGVKRLDRRILRVWLLGQAAGCH